MTTVSYSSYSPFYLTKQNSWALSTWTPRNIPAMSSDAPMILSQIYQYKPDLLAYDLYGDSRLWWVWIVRNPDVINDPIYDMVPGTVLMIPEPTALKAILGI